jgi:hypothetical protein
VNKFSLEVMEKFRLQVMVSWCCVLTAAALIAQDVSRVSYGAYFTFDREESLEVGRFLHTYLFDIPKKDIFDFHIDHVMESPGQDERGETIGSCLRYHDGNTTRRDDDLLKPAYRNLYETNSSMCYRYNYMIKRLLFAITHNKEMLMGKVKQIYDMLPPKVEFNSTRQTRALLGIVGELSKSLFGTATTQDVAKVVAHLNKVVEAVNEQGKLQKKSLGDMSAYSKIIDNRINSLIHIL